MDSPFKDEGAIEDPSIEEEFEDSTTKDLMDVDDIQTTIKANEEKALVNRFNTTIFRVETITKVESKSLIILEEGDEVDPL